MANSATQNDPTSFENFQKSGFYTGSGISALQEQLANYNMTDAQARQQAEAQYKPEYDLQRTQFENELSQLSAARDRDINKLNSQYDKTLNSVMAGLNSRSMGRSSLVATRGVETENARNAAISDTSFNYLTQQNEINANMQKAATAYAQSVENRATELKKESDAQRLQLMGQIAQLQQAGYSAYTNYLNQKDSLANDQQRIENEKLQYLNAQKKLDNEQLQLKNEKAKLANEKAKLANEKYKLQLAKKKKK